MAALHCGVKRNLDGRKDDSAGHEIEWQVHFLRAEILLADESSSGSQRPLFTIPANL